MLTVATVAGLAGLATRWWYTSQTANAVSDGDSPGLRAARAVAEGGLMWFVGDPGTVRPGALGSLILGVVTSLLGEPTARGVLAVVIGALASLLLIVVVRRRLAGPWPYVAGALLAGGSSVVIASGADPTDPIVITALLGLGLLALTESSRPPVWWAIGLIAGVGYWTSPLMTIMVIPAIVSLLVRRQWPANRQLSILLATTAVGSAARTVDEIRHGFPMARSMWDWPDDPMAHLRTRPLTMLGAALGLVDPNGAWSLPAGRWATLLIIGVLSVVVITVLLRQPRARSVLLIAVPAAVSLDLITGGWSTPAHELAPLLAPAAAVAVVVALSAITASARPSAAVIVMILVGAVGVGGALMDRWGDGQANGSDASTPSSMVENAADE